MGQAIIVAGASAGGVEALRGLVAALPPELPAAVFLVLHSSTAPSMLPRILARAGRLPVALAADGAAIRAGTIYVAPPGHHLLVSRGHMHVVEGPKENGFRPAIDPLFRSASRAYGRRALGVVLSGMLDDGTAGLLAIKAHGGVAIVQDPDEAIAPSMARSALSYVAVDHVATVGAMGPLLARLSAERAREEEEMADEVAPVLGDYGPVDVVGDEAGSPEPFSCPECGGVLSELREGTLLRFRCQIGHRYSPESVLASQAGGTQRALSGALTAVNERGLLLRRLAREALARDDPQATRRFDAQAEIAEGQRREMALLIASAEASVDGPT